MNRSMKNILSVALVMLVLFANTGTVFAAAADRNETVYVKMDPNGKTMSCDVVNWRDVQGKTEIQDVTSLKNVKVIPDTLKQIMDGNILKLNLSGSESRNIYYSGTTAAELPVQVDISYFLNGEEVSADKLAGAKGDIEIRVHLENRTGVNRAIAFNNFKTNSSDSFSKEEYTPFMGQVEIDLPLDTFYNIDAPDSASVVLGKTMKLIWMKFPYPDEEMSVKMKTDCFELDPVSVTIMPEMPPVTSIELEKSLKEMYDGSVQMDDKLKLLIDGVEKAHAGSGSLQAGIAKFSSAFGSAADGGKKLSNGLPVLSAGLKQASGAAGQLSLAGDAQIQMVDNINLANSELQQSIAQLAKTPGMEKAAAQLSAGLQKQQAMIGLLKEGGKLPTGQDFPGLKTTQEGLAELKAGIDKCAAGSDQSAAGAAALAAGLVKLDSALPEIKTGAANLDDGLQAIQNGLGDFRTLGEAKLKDGVADQINEVRKGLAEKEAVQQLVSDYTSFTGDSKDGGKVEFLLQTDSIKAPDTKIAVNTDDSAASTKVAQKNETFFEKIGDFFKNLFGGK